MKKIVITESQLKRLTNNIVLEQQVKLGGIPVSLDLNGDVKTNPNYGTLTFNIGNKKINIRLFTTKKGNVNIVKLIPKDDGIYIKTLMGIEKNLNKDTINKLIEYVNNPIGEVKLDSSILVGDLKAKKI